MNKKIGKEITKIILLLTFTIVVFQIGFASKIFGEDLFCGSPLFYNNQGVGLDPVGTTYNRYVVLLQQNYDSSQWTNNGWVNYNLEIKNNKNQPMTVCVNPSTDIQPHVHGGCLFDLQPGEERNLTLEVWIRQTVIGYLGITGYCSDGHTIDQYTPSLALILYVNKVEDINPQGNCFPPPAGCQADTRLFENYVCTDTGYVAQKRCVDWCCKGSGILYDTKAYCSSDGNACISELNVPPATEGNIALLCNNAQCLYEGNLKYLLRLQGYNVVGKYYNDWTEDQLKSYDIIACGNSGACKMNFNSPLYNAHVEDHKPFLEITQSQYAKAGYDFGYVSKNSASSTVANFYSISQDPIVGNYFHQFINMTNGITRYSAISNIYLNATTSLAESGTGDKSIFFKVDDTVDHGRYAFIGWMPHVSISGLTDDGKQVLNNTLKWLKQRTNPEKLGKVAFLCKDDKCNDKDEMFLIKSLRSFGYSVTAKSYKSWGSEISGYNLIVCRTGSSCKFATTNNLITSPIYNAHVNDGVPFLEIPESPNVYAAYIFGNTGDYKAKIKNIDYINVVDSSNPIVSGYGNSIYLFNKKRSMSGVGTQLLNSADDIAHINMSSGYSTLVAQDYSVVFTADGRSKYAFLGILPKSSTKYLTVDAIEILRRSVNWLNCGKINC